MYNKLHDGPPDNVYIHLPLGPRQPQSPRPSPVSIAALSWAAERAGQSYGQFVIGLSSAEQLSIQEEYDAYQAEQKRVKAEQKRLKAERMAEKSRVANTNTDIIPEGFILTDEDG